MGICYLIKSLPVFVTVILQMIKLCVAGFSSQRHFFFPFQTGMCSINGVRYAVVIKLCLLWHKAEAASMELTQGEEEVLMKRLWLVPIGTPGLYQRLRG